MSLPKGSAEKSYFDLTIEKDKIVSMKLDEQTSVIQQQKTNELMSKLRSKSDIMFKIDCRFLVSDPVPSEASFSRMPRKEQIPWKRSIHKLLLMHLMTGTSPMEMSPSMPVILNQEIKLHQKRKEPNQKLYK